MALGMVMQLPEEADETSISKRQLLAKLDVCMGGRVAEELIFGEGDVTTGASSDLEQVGPCAANRTHPAGVQGSCYMSSHSAGKHCTGVGQASWGCCLVALLQEGDYMM